MFELERYELMSGPAYRFQLGRRDIFKLLGGGVLVFLVLDPAEAQGPSLPDNLAAWLHIGEDGVVTVYTGKVEVGQNARTSLTQAVAEELRTNPESIRLVMGDTELTPFDMGTFGSRTTPIMAPQLHKVAAAAREMLLDRAAGMWKTGRESLAVENGSVRDTHSGRRLAFGELTRGQQLTKTIAPDIPVTAAPDWKVAGRDLEKVNARDIVTGKHQYASDIARPGMLHGRVVRPPAFNAKLLSADLTGAQRMPGVTAVHDGDFIAVACADPRKLPEAAAAIQADWKTQPQPGDQELFPRLRGASVASSYTVAYIAHVPLEPRAAVAEWNGGKLTVWTGSQRPFGVRGELAEAFGIPEDRVRVIVPDTGSAYGGKHTGEAAIEAARLAKAAGKPVKLVWTREEEFTWGYFRPAGVIDIQSAAGKDGSVTAWEFHNYNSGPSGIRSPYNIPNQKTEFHEAESPLRQGSYRGLAATANHFARESHMDELAHSIGMEPLAFRLKNTTDPRLRAVMVAATERFGWGAARTRAGQGFGMAAGFEKGGYVACCAEVMVAPAAKEIRLERVVEAFECGAIVNPEHLKNQIAGAMVMGIGGALFEAIRFDNGRILNPRLSQYRVPRFGDIPAIETVLIDRRDLPSAGAGETPIVAIAPAIANAVFNATGRRIRSMPLKIA